MKIRTGFVSNSSSSSFIIGFLDLTEVEKKQESIPLSVITHPDVFIGTYYQLKNMGEYNVNFIDNDNKNPKLRITSFNDHELEFEMKDKLNHKILIFDFTGNEGDDHFRVYNNDGVQEYDIEDDIDYYIDEIFFDLKESQIIKFIKDNGGEVEYGAARNG